VSAPITWARICHDCGASAEFSLPSFPLKAPAFMKVMAVVARTFSGWTYDQHGFALCPKCSP